MVTRSGFSMSGLVERTGVPPTTIHHYLRRGLLPPPERVASNRFIYDERHVRALELIRLLRERRHLPLEAVAEVLPVLLGQDDEEAFRAEMWDDVLRRHLRARNARSPAVRLLDAAIELFSRRGYGETNVDEISRVAGVAKGSLYRHYASKEELFFAAAEQGLVRALRDVDPPRRGGDEALARTVADAVAPHVPLLLDLLAGALQRRPGHRDVLRHVAGRLVREMAALAGDATTAGRVAERAAALVLLEVLGPGVPQQRVLRRLLGA